MLNNVKILKNTIINAGRDGMYVTGVNFEVAYNDVSYSQKINSDSGIFYTVGNDNLRNAEIHHNWFHDATAPAAIVPAPRAADFLRNERRSMSMP